MGQHGVPLSISVFAAVIEGNGHHAAVFQQPQPRVNGLQGGRGHGENLRVSAGQTAQIKHHTVDTLRLCILLHIGMTVQNHLRVEMFPLQQGTRGVDSLLLDIKGQHLSVLSCQAAEQCRIPSPASGGVDAVRPRFHKPIQEVVNHAQCIKPHRFPPFLLNFSKKSGHTHLGMAAW